jgi:hypothetical protein
MIHQHSPHQLRGDAEKLCTIAPRSPSLIHEAQIELVHQRRWSQRVLLPLTPHLPCSDPPALFIDERHQSHERRIVSVRPLNEKLCDVSAGSRRR